MNEISLANGRQQQGVIEALTNGITEWMHQWDITQAEQNATYENGVIDSIYMNGNQVCYNLQGNSNAICVPTPTGVNVFIIRDGDGNQYEVNLIPPPPKITGPTSYLDYSGDSLNASDTEIIYFESSVSQNYGFDGKEYAAFIKNYEAIKLKNDKNYFVPNKSIGKGETDEVIARMQITGLVTSQLIFKTTSGMVLPTSGANTTKKCRWRPKSCTSPGFPP